MILDSLVQVYPLKGLNVEESDDQNCAFISSNEIKKNNTLCVVNMFSGDKRKVILDFIERVKFMRDKCQQELPTKPKGKKTKAGQAADALADAKKDDVNDAMKNAENEKKN